jgi:DNA-binding transcriptional ArsR family regulator
MPRALHHPTRTQLSLASVLHALGDPVRLAFVQRMASCPKGSAMNCTTVGEVMADLALSTRHHHLRILREAGVIRATPNGKEVLNTLRKDDLEARFPGLLKAILKLQL